MHLLILSLSDLPLLLVICQCLLFAILLLTVNYGKKLSSLFLSLFLFAIGADALDTILYWSPAIKVQFFTDQINIFFIFKFGIYLAPQMLYLYVKSTIYSDYSFTKKEALHLIPVVLFPLYLVLLYTSFDDNQLRAGIRDYAILFNNPVFQIHLWARNILYVTYCLMAYNLLDGYKERLKENFSNIEKIDNTWLKLLVGGFLGIWLWTFSNHMLNHAHIPFDIADSIGIIGNFYLFIFINAIVFYSLAKSGIVKTVPSQPLEQIQESKEQDTVDQSAIDKLNKAMLDKKLFLDPELTIEQLADITSLTTRKISTIINRHFNQNFFDYINFHRVEQAKQILTQQGKDASMLDVMADAGFNSKSTFYRAFKKHMGMTPTEFCLYIQSTQQPPPN